MRVDATSRISLILVGKETKSKRKKKRRKRGEEWEQAQMRSDDSDVSVADFVITPSVSNSW